MCHTLRPHFLAAVASHAIGFADPRPGDHSPGVGACEEDGEDQGHASHRPRSWAPEVGGCSIGVLLKEARRC
jgi:hypothetical protein